MTKTSQANTWIIMIHLIFWASLCGLMGLVTYIFVPQIEIIIGYILVNLLGLLLLVYGNLWVLVPRFWDKKKWIVYAISLIVLISLTATFRYYLGWYMVKVFDWGIEGMFTPTYLGSMYGGGFFVIFISIPLKVVDSWFKQIELEQEIKTHKLEAELRFLKAQVNPHFLFNALNNIYSLSFMKSEKTPEMILKLSDMMSYMLYDCKNDEVLLASEVAYLQNYIDLQQLKKEGELNVAFEVKGDISGLMIKPMLLIPFIENAFKHSNLEDLKRGWLTSILQITEKNLHFSIENSILPQTPKYEKGGVGLENIQARLGLLYQGQHELNISQSKSVFAVSLKLPLVQSSPKIQIDKHSSHE